MRANTRDTANRSQNGSARGTLTKANDEPLMQEVDVEILKGEKKTTLERFQNYGFTSVPHKEDGEGSDKAAEFVIVFLGGNRSHGVIVAMDDRRHRLRNLKEGESAQYDDQGQKVHVSRDGIIIDGGKKELPVTIKVGSVTLVVKKDQIIGDVKGMKLSVKEDRIDLVKVPASIRMVTEDGPSNVIWGEIDKA
jgi:phage baseplate assembly protein V